MRSIRFLIHPGNSFIYPRVPYLHTMGEVQVSTEAKQLNISTQEFKSRHLTSKHQQTHTRIHFTKVLSLHLRNESIEQNHLPPGLLGLWVPSYPPFVCSLQQLEAALGNWHFPCGSVA